MFSGDSPDLIDGEYERLSSDSTFINNIPKIEHDFNNITNLLHSWKIDYDKFKIQGLSHYYALWVFAMLVYKKGYDKPNLDQHLNDFYIKLRNRAQDDEIVSYKQSMSSGTKSRSQRQRRIDALLKYCHLK